MPVLSAHCSTLKEATKCPGAKTQAPSERADSQAFLSSLCNSVPPSAKQKHLSHFAKHFDISTAKQGEGGCLPSRKQGAAFTPKTTTASTQNTGGEGAVADAAGMAADSDDEED